VDERGSGRQNVAISGPAISFVALLLRSRSLRYPRCAAVRCFPVVALSAHAIFAHCLLSKKGGNTEYKRHVHQATSSRLRSLATQMSYRLDEGHGFCTYRIGVEDDGCHSLLSYDEIAHSARLIEGIGRSLNAVVLERKIIQNEVVNDDKGNPIKSNEDPLVIYEDSTLGGAFGEHKQATPEQKDDIHLLRKEEGVYTRAELTIQRVETHLLDPQQPPPSNGDVSSSPTALPASGERPEHLSVGETLSARNIRVAVVGNVDAGKSTLIGTLTTSSLDDGRGKCRTSIMKHRHEIESGRTSTATTHLMGFRSTGQPIGGRDQVRANKRKGEDEIAREAYRVITLMDLAGHEKYLKTTYVCLVDGLAFCWIFFLLSRHLTCASLVFPLFAQKRQYSRRFLWLCRLCSHISEQSPPTNAYDSTPFESLLQLWDPSDCHLYKDRRLSGARIPDFEE